MPALSDYVTGTISLTNGSVDFTGTSTGWLLAGFKEGDTIIDITGATEYMGVVAAIDANGAGTLTKAWEGPTLVDVAYRMRYQPDGARVSAQARNLIELLGNGNLQAVAGLSGSANQVLMFTGPGTMTTVPKSDLVSGIDYDVQVANPAAQAAYDSQAEGFTVLISNMGDGRAAVESKASNASGDWTDPAYVTGPVGPLPTFSVDAVDTLPPGSDATFSVTPVTGGYEFDIGIPSGEGFSFRGAYSGTTTYFKGDVVASGGSSYIALQNSYGAALPVPPATTTSFWALLAQKGTDGAGTVSSLTAGQGIAVNNSNPTSPVVSLATVAEATVKGRPPGAGTGNVENLTPAQVRDITGQAWELIGLSTPSGAASIIWTNLSAFRWMRLRGWLAPSIPAPVGVQLSTDNGATWQAGTSYRREGMGTLSGGAPQNVSADAGYYYLNSIQNQAAGEVASFIMEMDNISGGRINMHTTMLHVGSTAGGRIVTRTSANTSFVGPINGLAITTPGATMNGRVILEGIRG